MNKYWKVRAGLDLYLVFDPDFCTGDSVETVEAAIRGGVTMVQLRAKHRTDREILTLGWQLRRLCRKYGIPFIMNDRVDLALAIIGSGVHLGADDLHPAAARRISNKHFIVGFSPESDEQAERVMPEDADYLGIGPVFGTSSKADAGDALGLEGFSRRRERTPLPVVAIGGINVANAAQVIEAGADGIAVVSAILGADDPEEAARELSAAIKQTLRGRRTGTSDCFAHVPPDIAWHKED
jgi:thiamine-phosphate pyrophosphorylase